MENPRNMSYYNSEESTRNMAVITTILRKFISETGYIQPIYSAGFTRIEPLLKRSTNGAYEKIKWSKNKVLKTNELGELQEEACSLIEQDRFTFRSWKLEQDKMFLSAAFDPKDGFVVIKYLTEDGSFFVVKVNLREDFYTISDIGYKKYTSESVIDTLNNNPEIDLCNVDECIPESLIEEDTGLIKEHQTGYRLTFETAINANKLIEIKSEIDKKMKGETI